MSLIRVLFLIISFFLASISCSQAQVTFKVISPDKRTVFEVGLGKAGSLRYRMLFDGNQVTDWSGLGILTGGSFANKFFKVVGGAITSNRSSFPWIFGERDSILNHYNQTELVCISPSISFLIQVRVFNGSIAFRYLLPEGNLNIQMFRKEATTFKFKSNFTIFQYNQESVFTPVGIDSLSKTCDFPATLTNGDLFVHIGEAENNQFTKAEIRKGDEKHCLAVAYTHDSVVRVTNRVLTAWRTISVSKTAIGLHAFSDLNYRLSAPSGIPVPPSVKPGKLIRSRLTTKDGLDCIDFAEKHNLQYIMFDAGWYGAEFRSSSDPTQVIPEIDMSKVIAYGKSKGIGVILYVNYVGLKQKLDTILPLYKEWGVAGLKFGFVDGLSQQGITWLHDAIRKVNDYGFVLNIHDNYKPTGLSKTYPSLLTQEGIRGDENSPDAFHNTVLPFTRFLAGAADFTFCFPNPKNSFSKNIKVSKAHQLALPVIYYSPLQAMFWYGAPNDYTNEPEFKFYDWVPTVWNESIYLSGEIGKYATVVRRYGESWYLGSIAGLEDCNSNVSLWFLDQERQYEAVVFEDNGSNGISERKLLVRKDDLFRIELKAKNGLAMIMRPLY